MSTKPCLFIGSAKESLEIVDALEDGLRDLLAVTRWDLDAYRPGHYTLEDLAGATAGADFAAFVLGRDDVTQSRGKMEPSPRDNVIFEAGLFTAVLGSARTFYVVDRVGTKLPSDWSGLTYLTYDKAEVRPRDKVYDAVKRIRQAVEELGSRSRSGSLARIVGSWWQFVLNQEEGSVLSLMHIQSEAPQESGVLVEGSAWSREGQRLARYRSCAAKYDKNTQTLFYYWSGEHPRDKAVPEFFGVGNITFAGITTPATRATGFYSESNRVQPQATNIRTTCYVRATPEEVSTLEQGSREARTDLVLAKLEMARSMEV